MIRIFTPGITPPSEQTEPSWWFAFSGSKLLVQSQRQEPIPSLMSLADIGLEPVRIQFLGTLDNQPCYSAELPMEAQIPEGMILKGLRELSGILDDDLFALSGRAVQIVEWDRTHQFCGHCAARMTQLPDERAKRCPNCGLVNYPRLSPAVIVLIARGEELLLARAPHFPAGMYGLVAGFVEPGESLEDTIKREVHEEVGITIKNLCYFGSQPWPFPNSLMVGFTAEYENGEIEIDPQELEVAAWFHKYNLPIIPPSISIARKLIDWFVGQP
ncbi:MULTISPECIES: NAD(+) diphosphatase [unclassified Leptolyngbya]|uniref:NAD(+) diphosphatase n=1 Tax=unclassified Leptolyngbya TaxID=2650499 RepID=UPI001682F805|nr:MULTISPECIES: NAD(+) diphosphatase [unclassified Leptolyngbya]MBD1909171.1 NAD(+) diphosphatase [Leptolyngbya sp. FACHB-8]MBD2158448.1 NAD(+) diphosphatase [Leptolyngbya sp. FACHB-16]